MAVMVATVVRVGARNARFQQWQALLGNRTKRQRAGEFLVQGVRPISLAVRYGWPVRALLYDDRHAHSAWATDLLDRVGAQRYAVSTELLAELGDKTEGVPELIAVVGLPPDDLARIPVRPDLLAVVFDRAASPGNIGTLIRSADAFGASALIVTGHAADPYDPKAVRASTGSLFALPVVRLPSHQPVLDWVRALRAGGTAVRLVGADERGETPIAELDLTGPTVLVVGNETAGLSSAWREACDQLTNIPMSGAASSLNAATAGSVALYEAARQRGRRPRPGD
jgi:TrmH family RNA methyltransferase